ncbi:hypothetical protein LguiA_011293 [Lonicera macranthoides]
MAHISRSLTNFLNDDVRVTFFGVDINENASKLHREYGIIKCGGTSSNSNNNNKVDICALAKSYFPFSHNSISSLKGIAYKVAGLSMRKRGNNKCIDNVDWEKRSMLCTFASLLCQPGILRISWQVRSILMEYECGLGVSQILHKNVGVYGFFFVCRKTSIQKEILSEGAASITSLVDEKLRVPSFATVTLVASTYIVSNSKE